MKNFIKLTVLIFTLVSVSAGFGDQNENRINEPGSLAKFSAGKVVVKLSKSNLEKINFIESVSLKYGYQDYEEVKKEYYTARMEVIRGDIILARQMLEKNKKNIEIIFKQISEKYGNRCSEIINQSVSMVSAYHIKVYESNDPDQTEKLRINKRRMEVAINQQKAGVKAEKNTKYKSAIKHYRKAKSIAIKVLKNLSAAGEQKKITDKYSTDINDYGSDHF